jgi:large subunit ribosomal protein L25
MPAPVDEESRDVSEVQLKAEPRTEFGKGAARRLRRAHKIPAVLYGHGSAPVHVALEGHATMLALKNTNALLSVDLDGSAQLALPKDVQRDPIRGHIEHVDLLIVLRGEKVRVDVRVQVRGEAASGTLVMNEMGMLSIEVEATAIPQSVEVDVTGAQAGAQIHASEIELPPGATLATDPDAVVISVTTPTAEAEAPVVETEDAEGAAATPA